jgi:hypothetical protein
LSLGKQAISGLDFAVLDGGRAGGQALRRTMVRSRRTMVHSRRSDIPMCFHVANGRGLD